MTKKYHYETKLVPKKDTSMTQVVIWAFVAVCGYGAAILATIEHVSQVEIFVSLLMGVMGSVNFAIRTEIRKVRVYDNELNEQTKNKFDL
jgi:hypothetical protein